MPSGKLNFLWITRLVSVHRTLNHSILLPGCFTLSGLIYFHCAWPARLFHSGHFFLSDYSRVFQTIPESDLCSLSSPMLWLTHGFYFPSIIYIPSVRYFCSSVIIFLDYPSAFHISVHMLLSSWPTTIHWSNKNYLPPMPETVRPTNQFLNSPAPFR